MYKNRLKIEGSALFPCTALKCMVGLFVALAALQPVSAQQGIILLEKPAPTTTTVVTATNQVILKPGFHAVASSGDFNAKIGAENSLFPTTMVIAEGSTVLAGNVFVPGMGRNYIKTTSYPTIDDPKTLTSFQYVDGLGRPTETVNVRSTPSGADLVSLVEYDNAGRENKKWLPAVISGNAGDYVEPTAFTSAAASSYASDSRPFVETLFEPSPLDRPLGQKGAGADWDQHPGTVDYQTNDGSVARFSVNSSNQLVRESNYEANTLYKTVSTDEDGKTATEYKDMEGQVVMKQSSDNVKTYYVYNDLDQLCFVLPPNFIDRMGGTTTFSEDNTLLKQFGYVYRYDERENCVYKRLPGCEPIFMVYDKADRLILSQDGNQRAKTPQQWTVTKYDMLGRVIYTGVINGEIADSEKAIVHNNLIIEYVGTDNQLGNTGYTCNYFVGRISPLIVNYYDSYDFISSTLTDPIKSQLRYDNSKESNGYTAQWADAKGLLTGTRTYILDGTGTNYLTAAMYYDDKGHVVQTRATNHLGGYDLAYSQYDLTELVKTLKIHNVAAIQNSVTELYTYTYDNAERPLTTKYSLNEGLEVTLASNTYDELGRLKEKKRHTGIDTEQYEYNIRNWATKIKSGSTFEENLFYNKDIPPLGAACYNGNIALSTWTYKGEKKGYMYHYDELNRLTDALSTIPDYADPDQNELYLGDFNEYFGYDKMGNINSLERRMNGYSIDDLRNFTYNGNQVTAISDNNGSQGLYSVKEYQDKAGDSQSEMSYDANGNMITDLDRNISTIQYNILNLPTVIQFSTGNQIKNTYDASGRKLGTEYFTFVNNLPVPITLTINTGDVLNCSYVPNLFDQNGTAYIGNFEYNTLHGNASLTTLSRIYNDEGYVENISSPQYYYYRKDHLGDNREVWRANDKTTVQYTQYYPSGLPWASNDGDNPGLQERKYNGKEFIEMHGYDVTDLGWRTDYNAIFRFTTLDRKSEKYPWQSPYCIAADNPVRYNDKNGEGASDPTPAVDTDEKITTAISTAAVKVPEKIEPIPAPPGLELKEAVKAANSQPNTQLSQADNRNLTPEDKAVAENPAVQAAVLVAVAPAAITVAEAAIVAIEGSVALTIGAGLVEGYILNKVDAPPLVPHLLDNPFFQLASDSYGNVKLLQNQYKPNEKK